LSSLFFIILFAKITYKLQISEAQAGKFCYPLFRNILTFKHIKTKLMKQKALIAAVCLLLLPLYTRAQVTIGSGIPAMQGALLDLKEYESDPVDNTTAIKGLGLPRVYLTKVDAITDISGAAGLETEHTGLVVYNIHEDLCIPDPFYKGVYVWRGQRWEYLRSSFPVASTIQSVSKYYFDLPSGRDARPMTPQTLQIAWNGKIPPTWTMGVSGSFPPLTTVPFIGSSLPPSLTNSPATITLLPDAMDASELTESDPWVSKESKMTFVDQCGQKTEIILNQTNYALQANSSTTDSRITYYRSSGNEIRVYSNAAWTTTLSNPKNMLAGTNPAIGTVNGQDLKNGNSIYMYPLFNYSTNDDTKYYTADITFKDTARVKRFEDITVSIFNCNTAQLDPTLEQWATERAGFTTEQVSGLAAGTTLLDGSSNPITTANGIQLHKDQDGNIFLSGDFGAMAGRWMLNNLAATNYASGVSHSQGRILTLDGSGSHPGGAYYYFSEKFNTNNRLGLLYNWDAATAGKGGSTGGLTINDGEDVTTAPPTIQGICPDGWHLPSDWEWTLLEQEITTNTSRYSNLPDIGGTIEKGDTSYRGIHGNAMKDPCPAPELASPGYPSGVSNVISNIPTSIPGMNIMFAGYRGGSADYNSYGNHANFWSASGTGFQQAWLRVFRSDSSLGKYVQRQSDLRGRMYSVRCKKD